MLAVVSAVRPPKEWPVSTSSLMSIEKSFPPDPPKMASWKLGFISVSSEIRAVISFKRISI